MHPLMMNLICLHQISFSRLWYKLDALFCTLKAFVKIDFSCPKSRHSSNAEVVIDIFVRMTVYPRTRLGKVLEQMISTT
ncbi:hypothetical protein EJ110_NYTH54507 [Nymphaea thermarum]|nr:hypothetical protein EJ110_NYTH54507 [Nymphaea thermarum]